VKPGLTHDSAGPRETAQDTTAEGGSRPHSRALPVPITGSVITPDGITEGCGGSAVAAFRDAVTA
jgi:hypothetical protein